MPTDILLDNSLDLLIQDGDLVSGEATRQHQTLLLLTEKGENREFPTRGVGIRQWQNDDVPGNLLGQIKREFEADGMTVLQVSGNGTQVQVEGEYE
jgi:hypothetical protein